MSELVTASLQFPTVVFTIALSIALVYWLFVLLGALDIDLLGGGHHDIDIGGAGKAAGHVLGGGDADVDAGADADGGTFLGLGDVPLTISVSFVLICGWSGSLLATHYISAGPWFRYLVLPLALLVALPVTAVLIRPLAPVFKIREGKSNTDYVGHQCTVSTGSVDEKFGQGTVEDGGTVLVIQIRSDRPGKLARGDKALIIEFDPSRQAYLVEPAADMLATSK
jgi:hypothetical protein